MNPADKKSIPMTEEQQVMMESYEKGAEEYFYRKSENNPYSEWIDAALEKVGSEAKILEIGSGNGWLSDYVEAEGYQVERTDGVEAFVKYQKEKGKNAFKLNLFEDNLKHEYYDLILAASVFHHFTREQFSLILEKMFQGLTPGGYLAFRTKKGESDGLADSYEGLRVYYCYWTEEPLREALEKAGFIVEKIGESGPKHLATLVRKA